MLQIPQSTKDYINAVTNPFDCSVPARIPDNDDSSSLSLKDYSSNNGLSITINATTTDCSGIAIGLVVGSNRLAEAGLIPNALYSLYVIPLASSGAPIGIATLTYANLGSLANYSNFFRFVGGGVRIKCLIEDVTVSTTIAVARTYAGSVKVQDVYTVYNASGNFYNLANQLDCLKMYNNAQGASVRIDPFQQIDDFKKYRSVADWETYASFNGNTYDMPLTITQFMNPVTRTGSPNSTYTIPLVVESVMWIEGLLLKPSPLFMSPSPCDLNFHKLAEIIATGCDGEFPIVVSFNSFSNFKTSLGRLATSAYKALGGSTILPNLANVAATRFIGAPIFSAPQKKMAAPVPAVQQRPKKRRKARKNNGNGARFGRAPIKQFNAAKSSKKGGRF